MKIIAGAALLTLVASSAQAGPREEIYEFTVITDTLQTPPLCRPSPCTFTEGKVPYKLATLTLTHDALRDHQAQLSDQTNPPTDDGRVISFIVPGSYFLSIPATNPLCPAGYPNRLFQTIPPCSSVARFKLGGDGYTLDLGPIIGNNLSGTIDILDEQPHGLGCNLRMQGSNGNWSGTWQCGFFETSILHSFHAIAMRVGHEHEHEKVSER